MQRAKLFAYVNNNIQVDIKRILQDKQFHLQLKSEQKEIIQNVLERRFNGSATHGLRKEHVLRSPLFGQGKIIYFFLMVICNLLLLLKSLPINVINCFKFYVNCSALTGTYDWKYKYLFVCLYANHLP
jgi:hypothetical protein